MKKTKIIIPALGVMLLSTAASVTGTVAWFSMNSFVNATNMNILAKAEEGIVISNEAKTLWTDSAIASKSSAVAVYPIQKAQPRMQTACPIAHSRLASMMAIHFGGQQDILRRDIPGTFHAESGRTHHHNK